MDERNPRLFIVSVILIGFGILALQFLWEVKSWMTRGQKPAIEAPVGQHKATTPQRALEYHDGGVIIVADHNHDPADN